MGYGLIFEDKHCIRLTALRKWGYLKAGDFCSGTLRWSESGASVTFSVDMTEAAAGEAHINLFYTYNQEQRMSYRVTLTPKRCNIGGGVRWYFLCPESGERCLNLYLFRGYFVSRKAVPGGLYQSQSFSRCMRAWERYFAPGELLEQKRKKYFRHTYNGHQTKRAKWIDAKLRRLAW